MAKGFVKIEEWYSVMFDAGMEKYILCTKLVPDAGFCWTESMAEGGYGGIKKDKEGGLIWEKRLQR